MSETRTTDHFIDHAAFGFIYAFKLYKRMNTLPTLDKGGRFVDCLENLVHKITHSDIIHVEIIPVLGFDPIDKGLKISRTAYSAYIGQGFDEHDSTFCMSDPTYKLVYIPMSYETMLSGLEYLHSQRGKQYNYLALPLTVLPSWCKKRKATSNGVSDDYHTDDYHSESPHYYDAYDDEYVMPVTIPMRTFPTKTPENILSNTPKVFCSQLGLTLCYLCNVFPLSYDFSTAFVQCYKKKEKKSHEKKKSDESFFIDPMCCTPAELYNLLTHDDDQSVAIAWPQDKIVIHEEY